MTIFPRGTAKVDSFSMGLPEFRENCPWVESWSSPSRPWVRLQISPSSDPGKAGEPLCENAVMVLTR